MEYYVVYAQREVRHCYIEAANVEEAKAKARELRDKDALPAGSFDYAADQELIVLRDGPGENDPVVEWFDGE